MEPTISGAFARTAAWIGLLASGLAMRAAAPLGYDHKGDAIIIAKMASDIATGAAYPLVYYGQRYMGALEAWLTAPLFWITGPTWWGIAFAPILVSTAGIAAFYLLGAALDGRPAGYAAAALWAIPPYAATYYSVTPRGCYPEAVCGGAVLLWYAVRRWRGNKPGAPAAFGVGILAGLLLWTSPITAPYVVTLALFVVLSHRQAPAGGETAAGLAGFAVGAIPFLAAGGLTGGHGPGELDLRGVWPNLKGLYWGLRLAYVPSGWTPAVTTPALAVAALMAAITFYYILEAAYRAIVRRSANGNPFLPVAVFVLVFTALFALNSKAAMANSRYTLPLQTAFIAAAALSCARLWRWRRAAAVAFAGSIITVNLAANFSGFSETAHSVRVKRERVAAQVSWLSAEGITAAIWSDYERIERLTYEALTRGVTFHAMETSGARDPRSALRVESHPDPAIVLPPGRHFENMQAFIESCCRKDFTVRRYGGNLFLTGVRPVMRRAKSIPPSLWDLDESLETLGDRVFSATLAAGGPFMVSLEREMPLTRVRVIFGSRWPDSIELQVSSDGLNWTTVGRPKGPSYLVPAGPRVYLRSPWKLEREFEEWNFPPAPARFVRFNTTVRPGAVYDIHELFLYEAADGTKEEPPAGEISRALSAAGVDHVAANRWVFANLAVTGGARASQPSLRAMNPELETSLWGAKPGFGALVDQADADELEARLAARGVVFSTVAVGGYTLFAFERDGPPTWWTGFTLIDP